MIDYAREIAFVRSACRLDTVREFAWPAASVVSGTMGPGIMRGIAEVIGRATDSSRIHGAMTEIWHSRYGTRPDRSDDPFVRTLWEASGEELGTMRAYGTTYTYRDIFGVPVGLSPNERGLAHSPAADEEIISRASGERWVFDKLSGSRGDQIVVTPDTDVVGGAVLDPRTASIISDIESIPGCRARLLWGPPRSGKSVAAKQIASSISGTWARVCGSVCRWPAVWRALDTLRPPALIIDDIDVNAGAESALMHGLERARDWARVIVSTANVVPGAGERRATIRGAVVGRASDGALIEYRELSPEVRRALAPNVPLEFDTGDLLAQHQVELQRRAVARGVTQSDVDELRELQALIGDR